MSKIHVAMPRKSGPPAIDKPLSRRRPSGAAVEPIEAVQHVEELVTAEADRGPEVAGVSGVRPGFFCRHSSVRVIDATTMSNAPVGAEAGRSRRKIDVEDPLRDAEEIGLAGDRQTIRPLQPHAAHVERVQSLHRQQQVGTVETVARSLRRVREWCSRFICEK